MNIEVRSLSDCSRVASPQGRLSVWLVLRMQHGNKNLENFVDESRT